MLSINQEETPPKQEKKKKGKKIQRKLNKVFTVTFFENFSLSLRVFHQRNSN